MNTNADLLRAILHVFLVAVWNKRGMDESWHGICSLGGALMIMHAGIHGQQLIPYMMDSKLRHITPASRHTASWHANNLTNDNYNSILSDSSCAFITIKKLAQWFQYHLSFVQDIKNCNSVMRALQQNMQKKNNNHTHAH